MKIISEQGFKGNLDQKFFVTMEYEAFSITKFGVLINKLALNELNINKEKIEKNGRFFFEEAIKECISLAKKGVDFRDWLNDDGNLKDWCKRYFLKKEKVSKEIIKEIQLEIKVFDNGQ